MKKKKKNRKRKRNGVHCECICNKYSTTASNAMSCFEIVIQCFMLIRLFYSHRKRSTTLQRAAPFNEKKEFMLSSFFF